MRRFTDGRAMRDLITSAVLAGITIVYLVQAMQLPASGATRTDIGPAAYPLLVGVLLALVTLVLAGQATVRLVRSRRCEPTRSSGEGGGRRDYRWFWGLAAMIAVTGAYLWILTPVGFLVATAAYLVAQLLILGGVRRQPPKRLAVVAVIFGCVGSVAIYLVFASFLGVLLPTGVFASLLA